MTGSRRTVTPLGRGAALVVVGGFVALAAAVGALALGGTAAGTPSSAAAADPLASTQLTAGGDTAAPGEEVTLSYTLENTGSETKGYIVDVDPLPDGFAVVDHSDDGGVYNANETKWLFDTVAPGERRTVSLTVRLPTDASGEYDVRAEAETTEGVQASAVATVVVTGSTTTDTTTETTTDTTTQTTTDTTTESGEGGPTDTTTESDSETPTETTSGSSTTTRTTAEGATQTDAETTTESSDGGATTGPSDPETSTEAVAKGSNPGFGTGFDAALVAGAVVLLGSMFWRRYRDL